MHERTLVRAAQADFARYRPKLPLLFIYGAKGPIRFHSKKWEDIVRDSHPTSEVRPRACGCDGWAQPVVRVQVVPYDCGHWISVKRAPRLNQQVLEWLRKN